MSFKECKYTFEGVNHSEASCIKYCYRVPLVLFQDEDEFKFTTFFCWIFNWFNCDLYSASLFGEEFYLKKIWVAIKFLAVYLYQLITSSISTINYILFKTNEVNPGLLTYETSLKVIGLLLFNDFNYYYSRIDSYSNF